MSKIYEVSLIFIHLFSFYCWNAGIADIGSAVFVILLTFTSLFLK